MYDELTRSDLQKMQEEIDYRTRQLRPKLIEDVQTARAFGDLSENFEYKCAKQEKNRNDSRIRYLQRMIKTAKVIEDKSDETTAGLYDTVEILMENTGKTRRITLVTTLRQDALKGLISKESPVGRAVLGRKAGDRVQVQMENGSTYWLQIGAGADGKRQHLLAANSERRKGDGRRLYPHRQLLTGGIHYGKTLGHRLRRQIFAPDGFRKVRLYHRLR